jgi:hypothetical protein
MAGPRRRLRPTIGGALAELPTYEDVFFDETTDVSAREVGYPITQGTQLSMLGDDGVKVISVPTFEADADAFKVLYTGP